MVIRFVNLLAGLRLRLHGPFVHTKESLVALRRSAPAWKLVGASWSICGLRYRAKVTRVYDLPRTFSLFVLCLVDVTPRLTYTVQHARWRRKHVHARASIFTLWCSFISSNEHYQIITCSPAGVMDPLRATSLRPRTHKDR